MTSSGHIKLKAHVLWDNNKRNASPLLYGTAEKRRLIAGRELLVRQDINNFCSLKATSVIGRCRERALPMALPIK